MLANRNGVVLTKLSKDLDNICFMQQQLFT